MPIQSIVRADLDMAAVTEGHTVHRRRCMSRDGSHRWWHYHMSQWCQEKLVTVYDGHSTAAAHRGLLAEMHLRAARKAQQSRIICTSY